MPAMQDRISIIIPVYNIRPYLDQCMESVTGQTHRNIEVILVDDGSTDGSGAVCDAWAARDSRVRCLHQANAGVSAARNRGFESSTGDYILFVDGDDRLAPDMCEKLWKAMTEAETDFCVCGFMKVDENKSEERHPAGRMVLDPGELLTRMVLDENYNVVVWNKMFRRKVLLDQNHRFIPFPVGVAIGEDQLWMVRIFNQCEKGIVIPDILYEWIRRSRSASNGQRIISPRILKLFDVDEACIRETRYPKAKKEMYMVSIKHIYSALWYACQERNHPAIAAMVQKYREARKKWHGGTLSELRIRDGLVWMIRMGIPPSQIIRLWSLWKKGMGRGDPEYERARVTIVTRYDDENVGNRLQNYALQKVLQDLSFQVPTVAYPFRKGRWAARGQKAPRQRAGHGVPGGQARWNRKRAKAFQAFNYNHICSQHVQRVEQIEPSGWYILGAGPVWDPAWYGEDKQKRKLFWLTFAPPEKKISFAPGFGGEALPEAWNPWVQKQLEEFPALGVGDGADASIVQALTGREAAVMPDPTLMLDREQWDEIAVKPEKIDTDKPYILTCFPDGCSAEAEQSVQACAAQLQAGVYRLEDLSQPVIYGTGPSEFLYLVAHAKLILTDSFHGCVFAFLYGKPFLAYDRQGEDKENRQVGAFLKTFGLERKYAAGDLENNLLECDYRQGYAVLGQERKRALQFLEKSLHLDD